MCGEKTGHECGLDGGSYPWVDRKAYTYEGGVACSDFVDVMLESQQYIFVCPDFE